MNTPQEQPSHYYIDAQGNLQEQAFGKPMPKGISYTHIARINAQELQRAIHHLTGLTPEMQLSISFAMSIDWLTKHINTHSPTSQQQLDDDVFALLSHDVIAGWWANHWLMRCVNMLELLADEAVRYHHRQLKGGVLYGKCHIEAQHLVALRFKELHARCLNEGSEEYTRLQDSYAALWPVIFKTLKK